MAISWLSALKVIPWGDVISHAPTVLEKARELIDRKRSGSDAVASSMATPNEPVADVPSLGELKNRLLAAQQQIAELHTHQAEMAQTLTALAEQNAALVVMVGALRAKQRMFVAAVFVLVILSLTLVLTACGGGENLGGIESQTSNASHALYAAGRCTGQSRSERLPAV